MASPDYRRLSAGWTAETPFPARLLPTYLWAIARVESNHDAGAVGPPPYNAWGLYQILPANWKSVTGGAKQSTDAATQTRALEALYRNEWATLRRLEPDAWQRLTQDTQGTHAALAAGIIHHSGLKNYMVWNIGPKGRAYIGSLYRALTSPPSGYEPFPKINSLDPMPARPKTLSTSHVMVALFVAGLFLLTLGRK